MVLFRIFLLLVNSIIFVQAIWHRIRLKKCCNHSASLSLVRFNLIQHLQKTIADSKLSTDNENGLMNISKKGFLLDASHNDLRVIVPWW